MNNPTLFYTKTGIGIESLSEKVITNNIDYFISLFKEYPEVVKQLKLIKELDENN